MYRRIEIGDMGDYCERKAKFGIYIFGHASAMVIAGDAMCKAGLPDLKRARYYNQCSPKYFFTEAGWKKCGHQVLSKIRSEGLIAKIIALKENDPRLNILARDTLQIIATIRKRS